jgi:NAD(P)-dependent dehydrogenase (short-subunit alcohol dehydrogenase family)
MNPALRREWLLVAGLLAGGLWLGRKKSGSILVGLGAVGLALRPTNAFSFRGRIALITGGSRGLGLALAEELLREGASVALLARDSREMDGACQQLKRRRLPMEKLQTIRCDVTDPKQLTQAVQQADRHFGRIDVLINSAGSIAVGPFEAMELSDFTALLKLQVDAVVNATQLVLPVFRRTGEGRIVNISSIGGRIPVPHMTTYCASKFALTGLSETLAAELAPFNVKVTTVYPGLMRTGSPIQAVFKGNHEKEYAWFAAGDVMPGISVSAGEAARKILDGVRQGSTQVTFPMVTRLGILGHALLPETYALLMRLAGRFMPAGKSTVRRTGAESRGWLDRQPWYQPLRWVEQAAERQWNQAGKSDADFNLGLSSRPSFAP